MAFANSFLPLPSIQISTATQVHCDILWDCGLQCSMNGNFHLKEQVFSFRGPRSILSAFSSAILHCSGIEVKRIGATAIAIKTFGLSSVVGGSLLLVLLSGRVS